MMKNILKCTGFALVACAVLGAKTAQSCEPSVASGTVCLSSSCSDLGRTTMDGNQKNLIACMKNNTGTGLVWKSMTSDGGGNAIVCSKEVRYGFSGQGAYTFPFSAAECGGTLPDTNYAGALQNMSACGGLTSVWIVDAGSGGPAAGGWFSEPCTWENGAQASFRAVYVRK